MMQYLSHRLQKIIPVYGNKNAEIEIKKIKSIQEGDACNTYWIGFENHWGTHIDAPAHFFNNAPSIANYPPDYWFFKYTQVIEIPVCKGVLIDIECLENKINIQTDLLLIKTGFQQWRGDKKYNVNNPGINSRVGRWLRDNYKSIKAIGFDFISISSYQNKDEGRLAHKAFLDPDASGNPILIIEDMNLDMDLSRLRQVWVVPLIFEGIDSSPCTVIGVFE